MHGSGLELTLVFLLAAVIAVPVFKRLGIGAVLAYLVAGVVAGAGRGWRWCAMRTGSWTRPKSAW